MKQLFIFVATAIVFCMAATQQAKAQKWFKFSDFHGDAYSFIRGPWYGEHDSVQLFDKENKIIQTFREPLVCQISPAGITSVGKADNTDRRTFVNDLIQINGETYICLNYGEYALMPRLQKLNKQTKNFEPVPNLKFSAEFKFHYLGNNQVWIIGAYFEGQDKNGTKELYGSSILDMVTDTLTRTHPTGGVTAYEGHSVAEKDQSIFVLNGGGLEVMHFGSTALKTSEYPSIILGGQFKKIVALSKENVFAIWQRTSDKVNLLLQLKNRKWETLSEISYPDPVTQSVASLDFSVTALEHYKGMLIISHTGSHINGNPVGPIAVYDTATRSWSGLPVPFALNNRSKFGESYVELVGDSVYLVQKNGNLIFGVQSVWLLEHNGLLPIVLKSFSGVSESGTHKLFWESITEQNFSHFEIQASKEGAVFETVRKVSGKGSGIYQEYFKTNGRTFYRLKMVDKDGLFRYSGVVVLEAPEVQGRVYPNPTTGNITVEIKRQGYLLVLDAAGRRLSSQRVFPGNHLINLPYLNGMYFLQVLNEEGELQKVHNILLRK
jgi:hypothetical protein